MGLRVYLAGGTHSGWQKKVIGQCPSCKCFDPSSKPKFADSCGYTAWDLLSVRQADVVFAYMEADNPGGHGLCVEVGFAHALGKPVVFVDGTIPGTSVNRYLGMVRSIACKTFDLLDDGIEFLHKLSQGRNGESDEVHFL